jgi:glycine dehydrogenase
VGNHQNWFSTEFWSNYYPGKHGQVYDYADFIKKAADNEIKK